MDTIYLQHHGILGMKWGVRRYQNKDGSLTAKGRARMKTNDEPAHDDYTKAHSKKSVRSMSDAELRSRLNRLQMEKTYRSMIGDRNINKGKSAVDSLLKAATTAAAVSGTALTLYNNAGKIKQIIEPMLKNKVAMSKAKCVL